MLEYLFNNVAGRQACNFIKKVPQHWCFPMKFSKFLGTPILKNISERLPPFVTCSEDICEDVFLLPLKVDNFIQ